MVAVKNADLFTVRLENAPEIHINPNLFPSRKALSKSKHLGVTIKIIMFQAKADNKESGQGSGKGVEIIRTGN